MCTRPNVFLYKYRLKAHHEAQMAQLWWASHFFFSFSIPTSQSFTIRRVHLSVWCAYVNAMAIAHTHAEANVRMEFVKPCVSVYVRFGIPRNVQERKSERASNKEPTKQKWRRNVANKRRWKGNVARCQTVHHIVWDFCFAYVCLVRLRLRVALLI